ncbi:hypothetical protein CQA49_03730 [Helicobacter sp. MIT 00-7814]|uniref:hypothetical protein n=1 Tax=unclassified Helicobacter TaxID=2593540 RepID=UPI000E1EAA93|nr:MULTISPECIES: hypothetical protein [unclassified Helicobacter]RDU53028.1 hypothetical protein CQA37_07550 [Helicobacter sp. MIT 99-10781]RDU55329.1 hypothetical protein CQA49_03730 [Helicobacter sp. MIT 00-7814]
MIEDVLRSQASAQQAPQSTKNSVPKEDFKKFLKQAQDEAQAQKSEVAPNAQKGATQGAQEVLESQKPSLSNALDSKAKPTTALTQTQNPTQSTKTLNPLAQALSTAPESKAQKETPNQNTTQNARIKLAKLPEPQNKLEQKELDSKNPKTLEDVLNLAKEQNLNPAKISAETESESLQTQVAPKPKPKPLSATQKIEYEFESKEERVAVINRGVRKPKNITSKISNIYEEAKKDEGTPSLSALLGQKDLPRQS